MALYLVDKRYAELGLDLASKDDKARVVLLQDGVYLGISPVEDRMEVFYVENDLAKRGIDKLPNGAKMINYDELIDMIEQEVVYNFI